MISVGMVKAFGGAAVLKKAASTRCAPKYLEIALETLASARPERRDLASRWRRLRCPSMMRDRGTR